MFLQISLLMCKVLLIDELHHPCMRCGGLQHQKSALLVLARNWSRRWLQVTTLQAAAVQNRNNEWYCVVLMFCRVYRGLQPTITVSYYWCITSVQSGFLTQGWLATALLFTTKLVSNNNDKIFTLDHKIFFMKLSFIWNHSRLSHFVKCTRVV